MTVAGFMHLLGCGSLLAIGIIALMVIGSELAGSWDRIVDALLWVED